MEGIKIINSDETELSPYRKMEEDNASQNQLNHHDSTSYSRFCKWPHQWTLFECCCGCTVRTGSLIIGWCFMLFSSFFLYGSLISPFPQALRWEEVLLTCVKVTANITLLIGIYKHKLCVVRIALILSLIDVVIEIIVLIVVSVMIHLSLPFLVGFFLLPIRIYFLVIISSLANQMAMGLVSLPKLGMTI